MSADILAFFLSIFAILSAIIFAELFFCNEIIRNHYAFQVVLKLSCFVPTGVENIIAKPTDEDVVKPIDVYSIDGRLIMRQVSPFEAYERLGRGIYIIGNKKVVKQ